jgi:predicted nucleotidyltransferase
MLGADAGLICLLSGNFVQRGEPAMFDKHARAKAAALCGADLVLELPLPYSVSSAEGFACGAVCLLDRLGCVDWLSFGSECGSIDELDRLAGLLLRPEMDELIKRELKAGLSTLRPGSAPRKHWRGAAEAAVGAHNILARVHKGADKARLRHKPQYRQARFQLQVATS